MSVLPLAAISLDGGLEPDSGRRQRGDWLSEMGAYLPCGLLSFRSRRQHYKADLMASEARPI